jgi:hypothetical protein
MRKIYSIFFLAAAGLVMATAISACFKNEDDISGPTVKIIQPQENDTVQLNKFFYIHINAEANDKDLRQITNMHIELTNLGSGFTLYSTDKLEYEQHCIYIDSIPTAIRYPRIYTLSKLILKISATNTNDASNTKQVSFFVKPY